MRKIPEESNAILNKEHERMKVFIDCDNFVIGSKDEKKSKPFGYNIPKVSAYLKEAAKKFEDLTEEELEKLKY